MQADAQQKHFEELKARAEDESHAPLTMDAFSENWNSSQFWVAISDFYRENRFQAANEVLSIHKKQPLFLQISC